MSKWVYRIERKTPDNGLWYNARNERVCEIGKIEGGKTKDLPMDYDCRYHKDGKNWFRLQDTKKLLTTGVVWGQVGSAGIADAAITPKNCGGCWRNIGWCADLTMFGSFWIE